MAVVAYALAQLADVKSHLFGSSPPSTYDSLLEDLINSCTEWIESECGGRRFKNSGVDIVEIHNGGFNGGNELFLKQWPIASITSIEVNNGSQGDPDWQALGVDEFTFESNTGIVYVNGVLAKGNANYRITYKGGFKTIPLDIKLACIKLVSKEFDKRRSQGAINESAGGNSVQWNENWQGFAAQDFYLMIRKYRNF